MSGLLDFFTLEASEYVEQLDGLVSRATSSPPEPEPFARALRALRGSATMAKVDGIAELASAMERLAKQVRDGKLAWDTETRGVAIAAVDDAKILIRGVRNWGSAQTQRAAARVDEIERIAPKPESASAESRKASNYLAKAAAEAAAALLEYVESPGSPQHFTLVMGKVRALRGVAALADLPPLAEVVDAVDAAAKPLELGLTEATAERRRLLRTAAKVLLEGGDAIRMGGAPPLNSAAVQEFTLAAAALGAQQDADHVVPIASLLEDVPDAVQAAPNPPTTAAQRFRLEVVSQAEHLRRLVHDGGRAQDGATKERLTREVRAAVRSLARAAQSFGATPIAELFLAAERGAAALQPETLGVLDRAAQRLSASDAAPDTLDADFAALMSSLATERPRAMTPSVAAVVAKRASSGEMAAVGAERMPTPARGSTATRTPTPAATRTATPASMPAVGNAGGAGSPPSGAALRDLLAVGIAGLAPLDEVRLADPVIGEDDDVIPIEELLYRGKDALRRAIEIGETLRQAASTPDDDTLAELYDLLQLAAVE
ncbi:MAG: hypothetical protein KF709_12490 [Gemmatimonadaceae bacterium]|nr:hypothetical protein [Gemmatimonadaceae bacterium]